MPVRSAWLVNRTDVESGQSRADTRLAPTGTMTPTSGLASRGGVIPGSPDGKSLMSAFYVFSSTAGMTATVAPGRAVVQGSEAAGAYPVVLTDYTTVVFADGDANNPRIDLVVLRIYDAQVDKSGRTEAVLEIVQGAPEGNPQVPQTPAASLPLATVRVPAGASVGTGGIAWASAVANLRTSTVAAGGILPLYGNTNEPGAYPGQYRDIGVQLQRWDGNTWVGYPSQLGGIAPTGQLAAGGYVGQYRDNNGRLERWSGTDWVLAVPNPAFSYNTDGGYCKTTTWTEAVTDTVGPTITTTFTAPVSGRVLVHLGFQGQPSVEGGWGRMSVNIRKNGVLVTGLGADETRSAIDTGRGNQSVSTVFQITGLQAGATYTAVSAYCSGATTNNHWFDNRFIRVDPML
ncbi:hypothetical protein [uncultured Streptomyces sp.]|uniref:hypothetical protein n=1 Tax=uncultured Streptomyces sp. TaxID=174707 RepID=UPI002607A012|nr:hypothetical protein [uncultured Streptomyces sp.]